jgi:DNA-binding transcriptional LysR family regulator
MNILALKYAVEVAKTGSINKAALSLYVAQPNISRSIKELENQLEITIFERTSKGMKLTAEGEQFISYARKILKQLDEIEDVFKNGRPNHHVFSISVPRASYVSFALAEFSTRLSHLPECEIFYKETNSARAIKNLLEHDFNLGVIRYAEQHEKRFMDMFEEKKLHHEQITAFQYVLIMSKDSPLAKLDVICFDDLLEYIEIAHADPYVPSLPLSVVKKEELLVDPHRKIYVYERASQFDVLAKNHLAFMWVSPVPALTLERYGLVQRKCLDNKRLYKDVLVYEQSYHLSDLDKMFIDELLKAKHQYME